MARGIYREFDPVLEGRAGVHSAPGWVTTSRISSAACLPQAGMNFPG